MKMPKIKIPIEKKDVYYASFLLTGAHKRLPQKCGLRVELKDILACLFFKKLKEIYLQYENTEKYASYKKNGMDRIISPFTGLHKRISIHFGMHM